MTTRFTPNFPASCPFVTTVGATKYVNPEIAAEFSSGGFSERFPRPRYQDDAVRAYLKILGDQWKGLYNPQGRAFPDVSAQGVGFHIIVRNGTIEQQDQLFDGASASAPTFAAIISLLNNARLEHGQPPLGFLNPWLYRTGVKGLTDIVDGGSVGCFNPSCKSESC
jgi:tripeptidyl-peptidase-1